MNCAAKLKFLFEQYRQHGWKLEDLVLGHLESSGTNGAFTPQDTRFIAVSCLPDESALLVEWLDRTNPDYRGPARNYPIRMLQAGSADKSRDAIYKMLQHFIGEHPLSSVSTQLAATTTAAAAPVGARGSSLVGRGAARDSLEADAERIKPLIQEVKRLARRYNELSDQQEATRNQLLRTIGEIGSLHDAFASEPYAGSLVRSALALIVLASPTVWSVTDSPEEQEDHWIRLHACTWVLSWRAKPESGTVRSGMSIQLSLQTLVQDKDEQEFVDWWLQAAIDWYPDDDDARETLNDEAAEALNHEIPYWYTYVQVTGEPTSDISSVCRAILGGLYEMPAEGNFFACEELVGELEVLEAELGARGVV